MKIRLTLLFLISSILLLTLPGNKNGRASQSGKGNTGAPGDETVNGAPYTCSSCHSGGAISTNVIVSVLDSAGLPVTQYKPGQLYTARVSVNSSGPGLAGYGFQMIALRNTGNTDLDGFSDVNPNNYKIATIGNGRTYAEHANISASNTFNVRWTAPPAGTGNVTFYAAGNGVNNNGNSDGDGASTTSLQLLEETTLAAAEVEKTNVLARVFPNPVGDQALLEVNVPVAGEYELGAYSTSGEKVWSDSGKLPSGLGNFRIATQSWEPGTYFLHIRGPRGSATVKVLKL